MDKVKIKNIALSIMVTGLILLSSNTTSCEEERNVESLKQSTLTNHRIVNFYGKMRACKEYADTEQYSVIAKHKDVKPKWLIDVDGNAVIPQTMEIGENGKLPMTIAGSRGTFKPRGWGGD